jgi:hypothetical protein
MQPRYIPLILSVALTVLVLGIGGNILAQDDADRPTERIDATTILALESIADPTEFEVINFAAPGSAQIVLTTDVPVACQVVYGTTEDFGQLVFDPAMADFAIEDHNPILNNLESNQTYFYRLQGTDPNGRIYISEVMTFETPDFDAMAEPNNNLASPENGAEITGFSSAFGNAAIDERFGAGQAFDNDPTTEWSSAGDGDAAWIEVQLRERASISRIEFWSRQMTDGSSITREFTITTDDGTELGPFTVGGPDEADVIVFEVPFEAETLRFDLVDTTGGNTGAVEIGVFGEFIDE